MIPDAELAAGRLDGIAEQSRSRDTPKLAAGDHRRLTHLDAIRTIAAGLVVLFHLKLFGGPDLGPLSAGGAAGVGMFFALSGYLITKSARGTLGAYAVLRIARLWPAYLVAVVGLSLLTGIREAAGHPVAYALIIQDYNPATTQHLIVPAWTLAVEVAFYIMAPVLVRLPLGVTALLAAGSFAAWLGAVQAPGTITATGGYIPFAFWMFLPGILAARLARRPARGYVVLAIVLMALSLILPAVDPTQGRMMATLGYGFASGGTALLILGQPKVRFARLWTAGAAISYGVYLWHWDLGRVGGAWAVFLAIPVAALSYLLVVRPILRGARRLLDLHDADVRRHEIARAARPCSDLA